MASSFCKVWGCALLASSFVGLANMPRVFAEEPEELLETVSERQELSRSLLRREVEVRVSESQKRMSQEPQRVIEDLKSLDDLIRRAADLSTEERSKLQERVSRALRHASQRVLELEAADHERLARHAAARDRERALAVIESQQSRLDQLTKRFDALLDEGRLDLAVETADIAGESAKSGSPLSASLPANAGLRKNTQDVISTRIARQRGVVDTLHRAEVAHVPQSDEPPIVYMDAADWQELTRRRRPYAADFYNDKPAEAKIRKALDETTDCDFSETPLSDVIDYFKDRHGIEIQLDTKTLEEIGVGSEVPVTLNVKGVSLRSALRLLLRQFDLTYTYQDEVLFITTPDVAAATIIPRVYNVADLVMPIRTPNLSGAFGGVMGGGNSPFGQGAGNQNSSNPFGNNNPFGQNGQNIF